MPSHQSPGSTTVLTERLRAAGCVFAEEEADLLVATARTPAELDEMVARRVAGLPLHHVLRLGDFCGIPGGVDPRLLGPPCRTQLLVRQAPPVCRPGAVVV